MIENTPDKAQKESLKKFNVRQARIKQEMESRERNTIHEIQEGRQKQIADFHEQEHWAGNL